MLLPADFGVKVVSSRSLIAAEVFCYVLKVSHTKLSLLVKFGRFIVGALFSKFVVSLMLQAGVG